jgi:hypothetical protein
MAHVVDGLNGLRTLAIGMVVAALSAAMAAAPAQADPNLLVWRIAHDCMVAKWRRAEPRCGWTVAGYSCNSRGRSASSHAKSN